IAAISQLPSFVYRDAPIKDLHSFPTRRSSDLENGTARGTHGERRTAARPCRHRRRHRSLRRRHRLPRGAHRQPEIAVDVAAPVRSEEHTSELQSRENLVCRLLLEKKK